MKAISSSAGYILDLLFPIHCLRCGKNREDLPARERWICPACLGNILPRQEQVCPRCKEPSAGGETHGRCQSGCFLDGLWSAAFYDELLERAIHDFKFKFIKGLAYPLGEIMMRSVLEAAEYGPFQDIALAGFTKEAEEGVYMDEKKNVAAAALLIPVPLHPRRLKERGFNQAALLAQIVGDKFRLPVREDILLRVKNTPPQSKTKSGRERLENIAGAFSCPRPEEIRGRDIVLVDDISTTSATLEEGAKILKRAGARRVWGLVAARK